MAFISSFTSLFVPSHTGKEKGHTSQDMPLSQTTEVVIHPLMDINPHENSGQDSQQTSQEAMFTFTPPQITATSAIVSAPQAEMNSPVFRLPLLLPASMPGLTQSVWLRDIYSLELGLQLCHWLIKKDEMIAAQSEAIMALQEQLGHTQQHISKTVNVHKQLTARDSLIMEQGQVIKDLQRDIEIVDSKGQSEEWHRHLAERDSIIIQQTKAIQQLKDHLAKAETTMNSKIQKLKDQRDTELAAMAKKYDAAICQNEKSTGSVVQENGLNVPAQPAPPSLYSAQPDQPAPPALPSCVPLSVSTSPACLKKPMKRWANMKAIKLWWEKDNDPNHNKNQQHICNLFQEIFDHSTDEQFINHDVPKCEQVNAFATGSGPGPTELDVHWDLVGPLSMPWNQVVLQVLLDRLAQMWQDKGWTSQPQSDVYWQDAITRKFQHIKLVWEKSRPHAGEMPSQTAVWLMGAKDARLKKACADTRQRAMATKLSYLRTKQGNTEGVVWKWLSNMVMKLGADGMSAEESDEKDLTPMFHIKRMP
ncbi:hypothetical protein V8B97DRAFT_1917690 [Scleroderma yunnanense]